MEILNRFKSKKGDLQRAVEEAIRLWINKPTIENLKLQATNLYLPSKEREEAIKILGDMGDSAIDALLEIGNNIVLEPSERNTARDITKRL